MDADHVRALREGAYALAVFAALTGGLIGYLWGSNTLQEIVFEAGYSACVEDRRAQ